MSNNLVTFGLKNVHYAKATLGEGGTYTFAAPKALPGAQEFTSDIIGGSTPIYGDDHVIATLTQNSGRTLTLKLSHVTEEFKTEILGYKKVENGNIVEVANAQLATFALGLEFQGDAKARRTWYWLCSVTPISEGSKTKTDTVEANAITLNITVRPIEAQNGYLVTNIVAAKGDANYESFFNAVPDLPVISGGAE